MATSETLEKIERAEKVVSDLCYGRREWIINIPARPDEDPDLVIGGALQDAAAEIARLTRELEEARRKTVEAKEVLHDIADHECSYQVGGAEACPSVPRPRYGVGGRARMCGPCLAEAFFATPPADGGGDGG